LRGDGRERCDDVPILRPYPELVICGLLRFGERLDDMCGQAERLRVLGRLVGAAPFARPSADERARGVF